jgi:hypothetical protein
MREITPLLHDLFAYRGGWQSLPALAAWRSGNPSLWRRMAHCEPRPALRP